MYKATNLSRYIVSKCIDDNEPISNLQLQKILYFIQKEYLQERNGPAFGDDIEAWKFGPVVPNVYYEYCGFGASPISWLFEKFEIDDEDKKIIDPIIDKKRSFFPWELVSLTHKPGGAWDEIYKNGEGINKTIPINLIKDKG